MYNNENKYYEKKTLVTINSSDRIKQHKLITTLNPNKVEKNGLKIIDNKTILVSHIHNYEITDNLKFGITAMNILDDRHRELIGGAKMGRQVVFRLTSSF